MLRGARAAQKMPNRMSSHPEMDRSAPTSRSRPRRALLWTAGLALALLLGFFLREKNRSHPDPLEPSPYKATNAAGAVPLAGFADHETLRWRTAPHGTQVLDGVTFVCEGALRTAGLSAARDGKRYPGAALGVPINRSGSRIHLLHAAENAVDMVEGAPYARFVLHYANGEAREFELLFGVHGDDWVQGKGKPSEPVADPNSKIAWSQRRTGDGMPVRLYHTALDNPLPRIPVLAVDFISPLAEANLLLFGLTIDDDARPLAIPHGPGEKLGDAPVLAPITFVLQDAPDHPAAAARLAWTAEASRIRIDFPPFPADAQGRVTIQIPRGAIRVIQYQATASHGSAASGELRAGGTGVFPPRTVIKLTPSK